MGRMMTPCIHCPARVLCEKHGCYAWNDTARDKINDDLRRIDAAPQPKVNPWGWWRGAPSTWQR